MGVRITLGAMLEGPDIILRAWDIQGKTGLSTLSKKIMHAKKGGSVGIGKPKSAGPIQKWSPILMAEYRSLVAKFSFF